MADGMGKTTDKDRRQRGGQRRAQILDVALKLFAQKGMANVTTRQIAQAVGISQPSLYAHFRSADEIAAELCGAAFAQLADVLAREASQPAPTAERLHRMGRAYIEFGLNNPDMYRVAFMLEDSKQCVAGTEEGGFPTDPVLLAGLSCFGVMHQVVVEHLGEDCPEVTLAAQSIWAHVHGLVSLLIARSEFPWGDRENLITTHLERLAI